MAEQEEDPQFPVTFTQLAPSQVPEHVNIQFDAQLRSQLEPHELEPHPLLQELYVDAKNNVWDTPTHLVNLSYYKFQSDLLHRVYQPIFHSTNYNILYL